MVQSQRLERQKQTLPQSFDLPLFLQTLVLVFQQKPRAFPLYRSNSQLKPQAIGRKQQPTWLHLLVMNQLNLFSNKQRSHLLQK